MKAVALRALPAQRKLLKSTAHIVSFVGGYGSGKTRGAVMKSIQLGMANAPCVGIFVEPTYTMVRDVAMRSFEDFLTEHSVPYRMNKTEHWLRVADKFDILFRSGDQPERLVGINAGWAGIDEPAHQDETVAKVVLSRIRDPRAKLKQLFLTGTPEGFNWFYNWSHGDGVEVIRARSTDNPYLDPVYIEKMRQMYTEEEVQAYINGEFVRFEGGWYQKRPKILPHDDLFGFKAYRHPHETSGQIVIGVDSGGGVDRDSSAVAVIDKEDLGLCATWMSNTATVDQLCEQVQRAYLAYTRGEDRPHVPGFGRPSVQRPVVVVEVNGIGRYTFQILTTRLRVPSVEFKTTEDRRYRVLLAARSAVHAGAVYGPEELDHEAQNLVVQDGKFRGPKDLSMAIGFALAHIQDSPYVPPQVPRGRVVSFDRALTKASRF